MTNIQSKSLIIVCSFFAFGILILAATTLVQDSLIHTQKEVIDWQYEAIDNIHDNNIKLLQENLELRKQISYCDSLIMELESEGV